MVSAGRVLVTGATGFIAQHCIVQLLDAGYSVNATLRSLSKSDQVLKVISEHAREPESVRQRLSFFGADLLEDEGWGEAVKDCEGVLHVASPFPIGSPRDEEDLIKPAVEGTLRVLKAANFAGAKRVVLTSSCAAVGYGHTPPARKGVPEKFGPQDWTEVDNKKCRISAYTKSKTLAEKAAWKFMDDNKDKLSFSLATICPPLVLGPVLSSSFGTSASIILGMCKGELPLLPPLGFGVVDVRDVAAAHVSALQTPEAAGKRFITSAGYSTMTDLALQLKNMPESEEFVPATAVSKVSTRRLPMAVLWLGSFFQQQVADLYGDLNRIYDFDSSLTEDILRWKPRSPQVALVDLMKSLVKYGAVH